MTQHTSEIRIYVACLAAYNNGILHGRWIDADQSAENIWAEIAAFLSEHGALGGQLIAHFHDLDEARTAINEHYAGEYASLAEFAEELTEQTTEIPESLQPYIDYEAMGRDLAINDVFAIEIGFEAVHVFWSR